jgi:E3 ubiquitin-protein ligase RAD18
MSFKEMRPILLEKLGDQNSKVVPPKLQDASGDHNSNVNQEVIEIDDQDDDLEIVSETKKRKNEAHGLDAIFKRKKTPETKKASEAREVRMGTCPICSKELPLDVLESEHIDLCLNTPLIESSKPSDSSSSRVEPYIPKEPEQQYQKLNKLDFSSLSSNSLKQKLTKLELPSTGMRSQLEQRYNEYLILWNANCDSVQPKNPKVLRKQLAQWEASLKFKNGEAKQLDKEGWKELIKKAKGGLKKTVREDNYKKEEEGVDKETKKQIQIETIDIISTNEEKGESLEASNEDQNESVEPTQSSQERFFKD